ncbi:polysaccharide deacetylase family protein [Baekduia sp.]|uniref:polysaccharide deacetylase family protein n=1 Tax=Baekduia sp. TaxID=2600305 RepID=UPI002E073417|nr:polysaccharide deacetylase family protein [Baekduia sp.]
MPRAIREFQAPASGSANGIPRRFALTFDDGPDPRWTPAVLDALRATNARATFFVLGPCAAAHPELIVRTRAEGHAVGVHAYEHVRHTELDAKAGAADLDRALSVLERLDVRPEIWRTPWGVEAAWTRPTAAARGLRLVGWNADTHDWRGDAADTMLAAVAPAIEDGAIVLAHDGLGPGATRSGCEETVALIDPLVALARSRGMEPELLA